MVKISIVILVLASILAGCSGEMLPEASYGNELTDISSNSVVLKSTRSIYLASTPTDNDPDGGVVEIAALPDYLGAVGARFKNWDYLEVDHAEEKISFLALSEGFNQQCYTGLIRNLFEADAALDTCDIDSPPADALIVTWEVGAFEISGDRQFGDIAFLPRFVDAPSTLEKPAIFLMPQGTDAASATFMMRARNVDNAGFQAAKYSQDRASTGMGSRLTTETIGYVAIKHQKIGNGISENLKNSLPQYAEELEGGIAEIRDIPEYIDGLNLENIGFAPFLHTESERVLDGLYELNTLKINHLKMPLDIAGTNSISENACPLSIYLQEDQSEDSEIVHYHEWVNVMISMPLYSGAAGIYSQSITSNGEDNFSIRLHENDCSQSTINFDDHTVLSYGSGQDNVGGETIEKDGEAIVLEGNTWKAIELPYEVTANTVLEFDFSSTAQGEVHGIGFDNDTSASVGNTFKVYGTQTCCNRSFDNYVGNGKQHYTIRVGDYYTGDFSHLFFIMDHDSGASGNATFSNIQIYEDRIPETHAELSSEISPERENSTGTALISWTPPTGNQDNTPLTDLAGYRIYYGVSSGNYSDSIVINNPGVTSYLIENLASTTWYFSMTAVNSSDIESVASAEVSKSIN